jgi:hypothetical protein
MGNCDGSQEVQTIVFSEESNLWRETITRKKLDKYFGILIVMFLMCAVKPIYDQQSTPDGGGSGGHEIQDTFYNCGWEVLRYSQIALHQPQQ